MATTLPSNWSANHAPTAAELEQLLASVRVGAWQTPTYQNSWGPGGGTALRFRLLGGITDTVQLCGSIHSPNPFVGTTVFTLPVGFRPQGQQRITMTRDVATFDVVTINTSGTVVNINTTAGVDWFFNAFFQVDI